MRAGLFLELNEALVDLYSLHLLEHLVGGVEFPFFFLLLLVRRGGQLQIEPLGVLREEDLREMGKEFLFCYGLEHFDLQVLSVKFIAMTSELFLVPGVLFLQIDILLLQVCEYRFLLGLKFLVCESTTLELGMDFHKEVVDLVNEVFAGMLWTLDQETVTEDVPCGCLA